MKLVLAALICLTITCSFSQGAGLSFGKHTEVKATSQQGLDEKFIADLSAVEIVEKQGSKFFILACDEGCSIKIASSINGKLATDTVENINVLSEFFSTSGYEGVHEIEELDFEAMAVKGDFLAVAASASLKRKKPKGKSIKKDKKKLNTLSRACKQPIIKGEETLYPSDLLFVFKIGEIRDNSLELSPHKVFDVRSSLAKPAANGANPLTKNGNHFFNLPSKDNGLDIEGLTIINDEFLLGLRGPVLRGHALVVAFPFTAEVAERSLKVGMFASQPQFRFINLEGFGIRSLETVEDSVYIIAGPTMAITRTHFSVYKWDGKTDIFKQRRVIYSATEYEHCLDITPNNYELKPESLAYDSTEKKLHLYCDGDSIFCSYELPLE